MGRKGIKRRKPKHRLPAAANSGIIEDLEDQAEWSSYGTHIPRLGDDRRNAIWWRRGWRSWRGLRGMDRNQEFRKREWWLAIAIGGLMMVGVIVVLVLLAWLSWRLL